MDKVHCYHEAQRLVSQELGLSRYVIEKVLAEDCIGRKTRRYQASRSWIVHDGKVLPFPHKQYLKGNKLVYRTEYKGEVYDIPPDEMNNIAYTRRYRRLDEMHVISKKSGKYRDYKKGGWYTDLPKFEIVGYDIEYANIDCNCSLPYNTQISEEEIQKILDLS